MKQRIIAFKIRRLYGLYCLRAWRGKMFTSVGCVVGLCMWQVAAAAFNQDVTHIPTWVTCTNTPGLFTFRASDGINTYCTTKITVPLWGKLFESSDISVHRTGLPLVLTYGIGDVKHFAAVKRGAAIFAGNTVCWVYVPKCITKNVTELWLLTMLTMIFLLWLFLLLIYLFWICQENIF